MAGQPAEGHRFTVLRQSRGAKEHRGESRRCDTHDCPELARGQGGTHPLDRGSPLAIGLACLAAPNQGLLASRWPTMWQEFIDRSPSLVTCYVPVGNGPCIGFGECRARVQDEPRQKCALLCVESRSRRVTRLVAKQAPTPAAIPFRSSHLVNLLGTGASPTAASSRR